VERHDQRRSENQPRFDQQPLPRDDGHRGHEPPVRDQIYLKPSGTFDASAVTTIEFALRAKAGWGSSFLYLCFESPDGYLNGTWVYVANGMFGFNVSNTSSYQIISIPISNFRLNNPASVTRLRFYFIANGSPTGFYLDRIRLQTGLQVTVVSTGTDTSAVHKNVSAENFITMPAALAVLSSAPILGLNRMALSIPLAWNMNLTGL
jgi:hypothetical protein